MTVQSWEPPHKEICALLSVHFHRPPLSAHGKDWDRRRPGRASRPGLQGLPRLRGAGELEKPSGALDRSQLQGDDEVSGEGKDPALSRRRGGLS